MSVKNRFVRLSRLASWCIPILFGSSYLYAAADATTAELVSQLKLPAFTKTLFIDGSLQSGCLRYDPASRQCGAGEAHALHNIADAQTHAAPGMLFLIRDGKYAEVMHFKTSGREDAYIGYSAYHGEKVSLVNTDFWENGEEYGPLWFDQASYIFVNGIEVKGSVGYGRLLNAHHNVINNGRFIESNFWRDGRGKSKRGGLYIAFSHYNRVLNSYFYKGTDSLSIVHSDHNLIQGNRFDLAGHDLWNIKCGSFNVLRKNEFSNPNQKLGSVFDCEERSMVWHGNGAFAQQGDVVDRSQRNLIEDNVFRDAARYYSVSGGNGIQYAGQNGIIRFNRFYRVNVGITFSSYANEAMFNYGNRIYHNSFHNNWCVGIAVGSVLQKFKDNIMVNNILWDSQGLSEQQCEDKSAKQVLLRQQNVDIKFLNNNVASRLGKRVVGVWARTTTYRINQLGRRMAKNNVSVDPLFVNESTNNYQLQATSPMIDTGAFLATVSGKSGTGKLLQLDDVNYFYDGFSIPGEKGDVVQLQGSLQTATILKIDYEEKTLLLDKALTWEKGQKLSLSYSGTQPEIGAFEYQ